MLLLARLRAFTIALITLTPSLIHAREDLLFTSSVTYCEPPETILIRQFEIAFFPKNQTVFFNVSAASVEANVSVIATLFVNVYGLTAANITLDLCNILSGALCPLPVYNFTGSQYLQLPGTIEALSKIPSIAYKIPDLEAYAQLTLTEARTGKVKACVQATLSTGWSTQQRAVQFTTGGFAIFALLSAVWQSFSPDALAAYRLFDLMFLYQSIVTSSFFSLNYPTLYRGFALNYAWAMGLFATDGTSSLQNAINRMRHSTGGALAGASSGEAVGLVNRKLSPYNGIASLLSQNIFDGPSTFAQNMLATVLAAPTDEASISEINQLAVVTDVATVTEASANNLQAGLPIYVSYIHIATANAFPTMFICFLIYVAIILGVFLTGYTILFVLERKQWGNQDKVVHLKSNFPSFARAWTLRTSLLALLPVLVFTFYQWTIKDSWLAVLLSVILVLALGGYVAFEVYLTMRQAKRSTPEELYTAKSLSVHAPFYGQFRVPRYFFFLILLAAILMKAILVAFAKANGEVQIILTLIVEIFVFLSYVVLKPNKTRGGDVLSTYLSIVRMVTTGLMIAFVQRLDVTPIIRTVIGAIIAVIFSVAVVVMCINVLLNCGWQHLFGRGRQPSSDSSESTIAGLTPSVLEKGKSPTSPIEESEKNWVDRPHNPTPGHNTLQSDSPTGHLQPMVSSTPTTSGFPSISSWQTTLGSLVSRHWSFSQPSSPPNSTPPLHGSPLAEAPLDTTGQIAK